MLGRKPKQMENSALGRGKFFNWAIRAKKDKKKAGKKNVPVERVKMKNYSDGEEGKMGRKRGSETEEKLYIFHF